MNSEKIKEILDKIPVSLILVAYLGYLGYEYYFFENDPQSPKLVKKKEIESAQAVNVKLEARIKELNEFVKSLELKKQEIRSLAQQLQNIKGTLSESSDDASFMKIIYTEAKKVGITVLSLKPNGTTNKEYYSEKSFTFGYRGVFVQVIAFFDRLMNVSQIVRADNFTVKPTNSTGRFVQLEGEMELKTYKYLGSKADGIESSDPNSSNTGGAKPAGAPQNPRSGP